MTRHIIYGHQMNEARDGKRIDVNPEAVGPYTDILSGIEYTPIKSKFGSEIVWGDNSWRTLTLVVWDIRYPEERYHR